MNPPSFHECILTCRPNCQLNILKFIPSPHDSHSEERRDEESLFHPLQTPTHDYATQTLSDWPRHTEALTELKLRMQHPETANAARWKSGLQGPRGFFHPTGALAPEVHSHFDHDHSEDRRRIPIPWQLLIRITRTAFSEMLLTIPSICPCCRMSALSSRKDLCQ